jgi:hypothetical protein
VRLPITFLDLSASEETFRGDFLPRPLPLLLSSSPPLLLSRSHAPHAPHPRRLAAPPHRLSTWPSTFTTPPPWQRLARRPRSPLATATWHCRSLHPPPLSESLADLLSKEKLLLRSRLPQHLRRHASIPEPPSPAAPENSNLLLRTPALQLGGSAD